MLLVPAIILTSLLRVAHRFKGLPAAFTVPPRLEFQMSGFFFSFVVVQLREYNSVVLLTQLQVATMFE